jgi:hypothetical protein
VITTSRSGNPNLGRRSVPFPSALGDALAPLIVGKGRDDLVFTDQRGALVGVENREMPWEAQRVAAS